MKFNAKEVTINGVTYPSMSEASRELGIARSTLDNAKRLGRLTNFKHKTREPVPTLIRGVLYASQGEAAKALGVSRKSITGAMERGTLDSVGMRKHKNKPPDLV